MNFIIKGITTDDDIDEITELYIETYKQEPWNETWKKDIAKERIRDAIECNNAENYSINQANRIIGVMFGHKNYSNIVLLTKKAFPSELFYKKMGFGYL
jgi:hypothetical protein